MNNNLPTLDDLQHVWEDLCDIHAEHLEKHGVKLPKVRRYNDRAKSTDISQKHSEISIYLWSLNTRL